jgi:hypothetical protein
VSLLVPQQFLMIAHSVCTECTHLPCHIQRHENPSDAAPLGVLANYTRGILQNEKQRMAMNTYICVTATPPLTPINSHSRMRATHRTCSRKCMT